MDSLPQSRLRPCQPPPRGGLCSNVLFRQADTTFSGGVFGCFVIALHSYHSVMHIRSHPLRDETGCAWIFPRTKKVFAGHFFTPPSVGPSFQIPPSTAEKRTPSGWMGFFFLAEKEGFEPSIPFWGIRDFQSRALGHYATSP